MHRFFIEQEAIGSDRIDITSQSAGQISDVLRIKAGESIIVLDNTGMEYTVVLEQVTRRHTWGKIIGKRISTTEPRTQITLFQALTARDKFEHILQKCTEVGVAGFVPVITQRSIVRSGDKITDEKLRRRRAIITEAAEQSGRGIIPKLDKPLTLVDAADYPEKFDLKLVGSTQDNVEPLKNILRKWATTVQAPLDIASTGQIPNTIKKIALFIGPEGGFSDSEMEFLRLQAVVPFGLGRRILRTETAAVVASAIILHELED
jgi:16S rRNA (uracil1498-N3)-methyltransferase